MKARHLPMLALACLAGFSCSLADPATESLDAPGYRPGSDGAAAFLAKLPESRVAVLPGIVRTRKGNRFSPATRTTAVGFLKRHGLGSPRADQLQPDLGAPKGSTQFQLFQHDLQTLGKATAKLPEHDYSVTIVYLVTPTPDGGSAIGGIHVYVLDGTGADAFSFLLNSHHKAFVDAGLRAAGTGPEQVDTMVAKATTVALESLKRQVEESRERKAGTAE